MTSYVSVELRRAASERAGAVCEYCRIAEHLTFFGLQVDHIRSEKHGGDTALDNLAMACVYCNRFKGTDIGSIAGSTRSFVRFFNPRIDNWLIHFTTEGPLVVPRTPIAEATVAILQMNVSERIEERETLLLDPPLWPTLPSFNAHGTADNHGDAPADWRGLESKRD